MKGNVSTPEPLQGSEAETRELLGRPKEESVLPDEGSLKANQIKANH